MPSRHDKFAVGFPLGAVVGGAVALLAGAVARQPTPLRGRVIVGGVDLTNVDGSRPFLVDFSVDVEATTAKKRSALGRLRKALVEIQAAYPTWICTTEANAAAGRFVLHVQPLRLTLKPAARSFA